MQFDVHASQDPQAPVLILSSGLGGSGAYWQPQIEALTTRFRVVTYDHRGTGRTGGTVPADGGIGAMADDVLEVADRVGVDRFHFMGHALGGLIGLDLALRRSARVRSLVLVNAWSKADPHSGRCFDVRIGILETSSVEAFLKAQPLFLYTAQWMSDHADRLAAEEAHGLAHFQGRENILARIAALRAFDVDSRLGEITCPTLVFATKDDLLVSFSRSLRLAEGLGDGELVLWSAGAHAVNITRPDAFNAAVLPFLERLETVQ